MLVAILSQSAWIVFSVTIKNSLKDARLSVLTALSTKLWEHLVLQEPKS